MNSDLVSVSGFASSDSDLIDSLAGLPSRRGSCHLSTCRLHVRLFGWTPQPQRFCHLSMCRLHVLNPEKAKRRIEVKLGARAGTSCEESK